MLVIEIIPKDQSSSLVQIPKNGDRIQAYGAWLTDNPHRWNELHPAWELKKIAQYTLKLCRDLPVKNSP